MEMETVKRKENFRRLALVFTNPVKLLKEINQQSSVHTFFGVFVAVGILISVVATAMPYELFEQVYMKENYGEHFMNGVSAFTVDSTMDMFSEPYFRFPFYLVNFFWGDGLLILCSITFYWLALWGITKRRKYPVEFGDVANIFFISYTPLFLYMLGAILFQYFTGIVTLLPYNTSQYLIWSLANPFVIYQVVVMALGIEKTLGMNKMISWGLVLMYYGSWIMLQLQ